MAYFFHPLGEGAINYSADAYYSYAGHAVECIDIGVSSGTNVYSMTSGIVEFAGDGGAPGSGYNGYGGIVVIKTGGVGYNLFIGDLYILYAHLKEIKVNTGDNISAGTLIGLSGGANGDSMQGSSTGAHLHIEFRKEIETKNKAIEGLLTNNTNHISNWENVKEWSLARNIDGTTPAKIKNSFSYCHAIFSQSPEYIQGGIGLSPDVDVPSEYLNCIFSERFMGKYPPDTATKEDLMQDDYEALRILIDGAHNEFGMGNEGTSYAKLFRAWILYQPTVHYNYRADDATLNTFAQEWKQRVTDWGYASNHFGNNIINNNDEETCRTLMQNMYKNIANPGIFGLSADLDNYEEAIRACSNMPYSNETTVEGSSTPATHGQKLIFSVIAPFQGWGWYVLFRCKGGLLSANSAVLK